MVNNYRVVNAVGSGEDGADVLVIGLGQFGEGVVTASTKVINDGEGELATGNVVIYAKIDGNARAQLAASETAKINTVNRANKTATAVDSDTAWNESWCCCQRSSGGCRARSWRSEPCFP